MAATGGGDAENGALFFVLIFYIVKRTKTVNLLLLRDIDLKNSKNLFDIF